jgi:hypothetical protein
MARLSVRSRSLSRSVEDHLSLTDIHGFVQHFSFGGCSFFVHVDTSEINSGETFTP